MEHQKYMKSFFFLCCCNEGLSFTTMDVVYGDVMPKQHAGSVSKCKKNHNSLDALILCQSSFIYSLVT